MKSSTASDNDGKRQPSLRYFIVSNVRITLFGVLIFIILWLALELLFPRVTRADGAQSQATESVTEERAYPLATTKVLTDKANWGAVQWSVYPVFNKLGAEDCEIDAAQGGGMAMKERSISFKFVYGKPVEFYQETVPVKIARILDIFRAPEAAKDQLGMKLYDVDALSTLEYKTLLKGFEPMLQNAGMNAEGTDLEDRAEPMMAFVAALNTGAQTKISSWHEVAGKAGTFEFIGAPVQWNSGIAALMHYEAGESKLYKMLTECADYSETKLIKRAMYDVIASAEGIAEEGTADAQRFAESEVAKMYLAIVSKAFAPDGDLKGVNPIATVSFRSAWDAALAQKQQASTLKQTQEVSKEQ